MEAESAVEPTRIEKPDHEQPKADDDGPADNPCLVAVLKEHLTERRGAGAEDHEHRTKAQHEEHILAESRKFRCRGVLCLRSVQTLARHLGKVTGDRRQDARK
jgi:hypothetical protein